LRASWRADIVSANALQGPRWYDVEFVFWRS
jgi:hypothetical protein